ncbi:unnamed protein product, partial [Natator depressus]
CPRISERDLGPRTPATKTPPGPGRGLAGFGVCSELSPGTVVGTAGAFPERVVCEEVSSGRAEVRRGFCFPSQGDSSCLRFGAASGRRFVRVRVEPLSGRHRPFPATPTFRP